MKIELSRIVRGEEVTVCGDSFDGDPSVGIAYGPENVWATRDSDGSDFPLTEQESDRFTVELSEAYYDQDSFLD